MKKIISIFALVFFLAFAFACTKNEKTNAPKEEYKFSISLEDINLKVGDKYTIDTSKETLDLFFESSDTKVFTINDLGEITAKKAGEGTVTISLYDDENTFVTIKVKVSEKEESGEVNPTPSQPTEEPKITSLTITCASTVDEGKALTVVANYDKSIAVDLSWEVSDETLATFDGTTLNALKPGVVVLTVTDSISGLTATKSIIINKVLDDLGIANIIMNWAILQVGTQGSSEVRLVHTHPDYKEAKISWDSSNHTLFDPEEGFLDLVDYDETVEVTCYVEYKEIKLDETYTFTVISYPVYQMAEKFISQFKGDAVYNDIHLNTSYESYGGTTITWRSSNPSILANDGTYNRPYNDEYIDIIYTVSLNNPKASREFTKTIRAEGMNIVQKAELIVDYLKNNVGYDGCISSDTELPTRIEEYKADIEWLTTTGDPLDLSLVAGNPILSETAVTIVAKITIDGQTTSAPIQFIALSKELTSKWDLIDLFVDTIASQGVNQFKYVLITWTGTSYGYVPFTTNADAPIVQDILPYTYGNQRTGIVRETTEYITVHDTGNTSSGANAEMHRRYITNLNNSADSTAISWNFVVDQDQIIQHLPSNEVAWHAGDGGSVKLTFTDTGIKYNGIVDWSIIDNYYAINGKKTSIPIPSDAQNKSYKIPTLGFNYKVGSNGNVWMGNTYYNSSYNTISNRGGNLNSVGIESCVNEGSDYTQTMRLLAKLVAGLCIEYNLTTDRVKQHNTFSGKNCPQVLRENNRWDEFMILVKLNYFAMSQLKDCKIEYKSLTPEIMDDNGKILKKVDNGVVVRYEIKVTYGGETKTYTKSATVNSRIG